jgi:serine/threonine-protein phosphatase 2A activator
MHNFYELPLYDLTDTSLIDKWNYPQKQIYSSFDIPLFQSSKAIKHINGIISLICSKISLTDVPLHALNNKFVNFEDKLNNNNNNNNSYDNNNNNIEKSLHSNNHIIPYHLQQLPSPLPPKFCEIVDESQFQPITLSIIAILKEFNKLKNETPPFLGPRRYGNLACRDWHYKLNTNVDNILKNSLYKYFEKNINYEKNFNGFMNEIKYYLLGAFGSSERLDYGTGHELSFISFLGCLVMSNLINRNLITGSEWLLILSKYYDLVKSLILTYTLEPAGSHGVWGLDDHFHLIYVFGSCQLIDFNNFESNDNQNSMNEDRVKVLNYRMDLTPSSILNPEVLKNQRTKNLYYNAISFIRKVKLGPFNEHSPILYQISRSKNWEKVFSGMLKMYYGEVLSKFPVVQHFYFGGVFYPWTDMDGVQLSSSESNSDNFRNDTESQNQTEYYVSNLNATMSSRYPRHSNDLLHSQNTHHKTKESLIRSPLTTVNNYRKARLPAPLEPFGSSDVTASSSSKQNLHQRL